MGIYSNDVESKLLNTPVNDNILFGYDNYTYHIQFFMIPKEIQEIYSERKSSLRDNEELRNMLNKNKIIIAESGYSTDINIVSFDTKTIPTTASELSSITTEMKLVIEEVGGNSLVNKIALTSIMLGYNGYVGQPYYVNVWFTGYDNKDAIAGVPRKIIGNEIYTYQVVLDEVKTSVDFAKTTYTFHMTTINFEANTKEFALINDISKFEFSSGMSFTSVMKVVEERVNEKYKDRYGEDIISQVYSGRNPLSINVVYPTYYNEETKREERIVEPNLKEGFVHTPEETETLSNLVKKIWYQADPKSSCVPAILYDFKYLGNANNKTYYAMTMNIILQKIPRLDSMKEKMVNNTYFNDIEKEQELYLKDIINFGSLVKRYYYNLNGKDTSVLSYDQSDDNLWYLNTAANDIQEVYDNTIQNNYKEFEDVDAEQQITNDSLGKRIKNLRDKSSMVFMDDLFNLLTAKDKAFLSRYRYRASTFSDVLNTKQETNTINEEEKSSSPNITDENMKNSVATIGAENMLSTAQKLELKLTILGDPYWLEFGTEANQSDAEMLLPHVVMCIKSFTKLDGNDDYKEDKLMEINTLYRIIEIDSTFSGGKFTQKLTGVVATPFVQSSKNSNIIDTALKRASNSVPK